MSTMTYESNLSAAVLRLDRQRENAKQRSKMAEQAADMVKRVELGQRKARRNLMAQFDRAALDVQKDELQKKREELEAAEKEREEAKEQTKRVEMMVEGVKRKVAVVQGGCEETVGQQFPAGTFSMDNLEYSIQVVKEREEMRRDQKNAANELEKRKAELEEMKKSLLRIQEKVQKKEAAIVEIAELQNLAFEKERRLKMLGNEMRIRNAVSIDKERCMRERMKMKDQNKERLEAQLAAVQEGRLL